MPEPVQRARVFVIEDMTRDARFAGNPLVAGPMGLRFYAGVQLIAPNNHRLGALCAISKTPRKMQVRRNGRLR